MGRMIRLPVERWAAKIARLRLRRPLLQNYQTLTDEELDHRVNAIYTKVSNSIERGNPNNDELQVHELQMQLASLANLLPDIHRTRSADLLNAAESAAAALTSDPPYLAFAESVIPDLAQRTFKLNEPLKSYFQAMIGPVRLVLLGLSCFISILMLLWSEIFSGVTWLAQQQLGGAVGGAVDKDTVQAVIAAGAAGAIVSLLLRLARFEQGQPNVRGVSLFLTGLFKPAIGTVFAIFICGMVRSQLIPIEIVAEPPGTFLISLAFITGFSERFAEDIIARARLRY